jgi:hypothetical protein
MSGFLSAAYRKQSHGHLDGATILPMELPKALLWTKITLAGFFSRPLQHRTNKAIWRR